MSSHPQPARPFADPGWLLLQAVVLVALVAVAALLLVWRQAERRDALHAEALRLDGLVGLVEDNLGRQFEAAYGVMQGLHGQRLAEIVDGAPPPDPAAMALRLRELSRAMPAVRMMRWLDAEGRTVSSSEPEFAGVEFGHQPYVREIQRMPTRSGLLVSEPFATRLGVWSFNLALSLTDGGELRGILIATVDPAYFQSLLHGVRDRPDMRAELRHATGTLMLASPAADEGGEAPAAAPSAAAPDEAALLRATGRVAPAGVPMPQPLALQLERPVEAVLQPWSRLNRQIGGAYVGLAALALLGMGWLGRRRRQAEREAALRVRERQQHAERLELALRGADLALWDLDLRSRRLTVNARWFELLGMPPGAIETDEAAWVALVHPEDREQALAARAAHLRGETVQYEWSYRLRRADGTWIWLADLGRVLERDGRGEPVRMVGTLRDISERRAAEERLRRSEESLAITLESIGDAVVATDAQGRVTRLNAAAQRMTGWTLTDAAGLPLTEVFRIRNARSGEPVINPVAQVLAAGEVIGLANDTVLTARDGRERQIADSAAPIRDAHGAIVGVVLVFSDVTEQYRVVQALRERERELSAITDALPGPVSRVDREGRYRFANDSYRRWFGLGSPSVVGRTQRELLGEQRYAFVRPYVERALRGEPVRYEGSLLDDRGQRRHLLFNLIPDIDDQGQVQGHFTVSADITERHAAEQALAASERQLRTLLDTLSTGVVVHGADTAVLDANPAACRLLGLSLAQMRGREAVHPDWRFLDEDGLPLPLERYPVSQVLASGQPLKSFGGGVLVPGRPGTTWVLCDAFAVHAAAGIERVVVTFVDVTERRQALDAMRHSADRLRLSARLAQLGEWRVSWPDGGLSMPGDTLALLGLAAAPASVDDALQRVQAEQLPILRAAVDAAVAGAPAFDRELDFRTDDGRSLHLRLLGEAVRGPDGEVTAIQGAVQDVTEAHRADQELRLMQACVAQLNDVVVVTAAEPLDAPGPNIVFVNQAFERLTGWRSAEVLGRSPRMLQGPGTDAAELARVGRALRARQPVRAELMNYAKDGRPYWIDLSIVPVVAVSGQVSHFVAVHRDITDRRHAEQALREAQQALQATLEAVPDPLFEVDADGRIVDAHTPRSELLLRPPENIIGRNVSEILPAGAAGVVRAALDEALLAGHASGHQYTLDLAIGRRWFELSVARKAVAPDQTPLFVALARDITERHRAETERQALQAQLAEAQRTESVGTLASGIAHDFNNLLAAILGNVALARGDLPPEHPAQLSLDQVHTAGVRARTVVQQILAYSRRQPRSLRCEALRPVVEETLALLRPLLPAGVRVDARLAGAPVTVHADVGQLQQVLMNLCTNAWQALPPQGGRIEVGLEALPSMDAAPCPPSPLRPIAAGPVAHLWVRDNGSGIDAATRERVFDPFYTTKPKGQGTGLGLPVVMGIVRDHQGALALESAAGAGSCFHVYLPLAVPQACEPAAEAVPTEVLVAGQGEHILYVDDDPVMLLMVERLLQRAGWRVTACASADDAEAVFGIDPDGFALLVTDYNMPGRSGLELCEALHALRPGLPTIVSSGFLAEELQTRAQAAGVLALMRKEFTLEELPALVARVLDDVRQGRVRAARDPAVTPGAGQREDTGGDPGRAT
jgi:PAS domain S-box-containing protein